MAKADLIKLNAEMYDVDNVPVKILRTHPESVVPSYSKDGDAGADVRVIPNTQTYERSINGLDEKLERVILEPGDYLIPPLSTVTLLTGLRIQLLPGWEMQVRSRSGMAKRGLAVANSPGTIDSGYRGECAVMLHNNTQSHRIIKPGTRVAQFVLKRAPQAEYIEVDSLDDSERGEGGFGSTGTK